MTKISLRATGGLNQDVDANNLPVGDYLSANNIVFDGGKDGGAGAIKMLDSIKTLGLTAISGTIKETFLNTDGVIYILSRTDATYASIYKIVPNMAVSPVTYSNPIQILTYLHGGVSTTFVPDLRVLGSTIVWNYAKEGNDEGIPLSFYIPNYVSTLLTPVLSDLKLQKQTPNNVVAITKTIGTGKEFLESSDFQFAFRYQYSSYEFSALSNYTQIFKGEKNTESYSFAFTFSSIPTWASFIESYVRIGNNGTWRRIDTAATSNYTLTWTGQIYESLDIITTGKPFDAVPVSAYSIEVAKNRIFLANIQDEYNEISSITPPSSISSGYSFPTGTTVKTFKASTTTDTTVTSTESGSYIKPFANNSTYAIGVAFYDAAMKTRGVEGKYTKFTTGNFDYPIVPDLTFTISGGAPSWAKFAQVVYSKNISKSYIFEGYASSIFFEITKTVVNELTKEVTTVKSFIQSVTKDDLKNITAFVIDIMGMFRAGKIYTWSDGDYASIKTPNGLLTLKIIGQLDNLVYCAYTGAEMTNTTVVDPATLPFEFYTPKQQQADESLVFYEYGNLIPVTTATTSIAVTASGTLNGPASGSKLLGDTVFSIIDMPTYTVSPFTVDVTKSSPVVEDVVTIVNSTHAFSTLQLGAVGNGGYLDNYTATPKSETPILTSIPTNGDGATILDNTNTAASTGTSFKVSGYYVPAEQESGVNKLSITYNLQSTEVMSLLTPPSGSIYTASLDYTLTAQVYKNPFNNTTFAYDKTPEKFGTPFNIATPRSVLMATTGTVVDFTSTQVIDFKNDIKEDVKPNDAFYVVLTLEFSARGYLDQSTVTIAKKTGQTNSIVFNWNGDRTPVNSITSFNYNAPVSATKGKYLIRSVSNATANPYWNTSSGKPLLAASNIISQRRLNTIRYGGNYVQGTKVNNVNSFFSLDSNDVAIENGDITSLQRATRLQGNGSMMLVLCQKESAYIMLGEQELSQGNNSSIRSLTANMIGTIRNFGNNLGMLDKKSVMNYKGTIWWWDDFNKKVIKYTPDGLELVSDTYMRSAFRNKSGIATFSYDAFHNMCFVAIGSETQSLGYSDNLKRWIAAYDFVPDYFESFGDRMIIFKNGTIYRSLESNNKTDYNAFLGNAAVNGNIKFTVNSQLPVMPLNIAVLHDMNVTDWSQPNYVKSSLMTIDITNDNGQTSSINETNWLLEDNRIYAHIMRDSSSTGGLIEGNYIVGYLNNFLLTLKDKTQNMRVNSIDIEVNPITGHS